MFGDWFLPFFVWLGLAQSPALFIDEQALAIESRELSEDQLNKNLARILGGIYQAFSAETEEMIYDGLAKVVDGELLSDLYLQQRRAAVHGVMSGVSSEIVDVELFKSVAEKLDDTYRIDAGWRVFGRLEHETHAHERVNIYQANVSIAAIRGQWRLTAFDLNNVERENLDEFVGGE